MHRHHPLLRPTTRRTVNSAPRRHSLRLLAPIAVASALVLGACGDDSTTSDEPNPTTPATPAPTEPTPTPEPTEPSPTDPGPTEPGPTEPAPTTEPPGPVDDGPYETIQAIIDDGTGPKLCFLVLESLPPQCGDGIDLVDWSWDSIDVEQVDGSATWVDQIHLTGTYDRDANEFTVEAARVPTDEDRERLLFDRPLPDYSNPCEVPEGGYPERTEDWPMEQIEAIDGYAGTWVDPSERVIIVAVTGDLAEAEAAIREVYSEGLCVVAAERSQAELEAIQAELAAADTPTVLSSSIYVDASGERVEAVVVAPDAELQASFDAEYGEGVVVLDSILTPVEA